MLKLFSGIPGGVIIDTEGVDHDEKGNPRRREDMIGFVVGKGPFDDSRFVFNAFDVLVYEGKALDSMPWSERQKFLRRALPRDTQHFNRVEPIVAKTRDAFLRAVRKVAALRGSEGAMIKAVEGDYPLDGSTSTWAKFKNVKQIHALITGKIRKKKPAGQKGPARTFVYEVAIRDGGKIWPLGRTFGTNIDAKVGTILELSVNNVFHNRDKEGKVVGYGLFLPWVVAQAPSRTKTSTKEHMDRLVAQGGGVARPAKKIKLTDELRDAVVKGVLVKVMNRMAFDMDAPDSVLLQCKACQAVFHIRELRHLIDENLGVAECPNCRDDLIAQHSGGESLDFIAPGKAKDEGELTQAEITARAQALTRPYMVKQPPRKTQPFTYQWHVRGIDPELPTGKIIPNARDGRGETMSIHGDIRFQRPAGNDLVGWTMFTPGNQRKRDKFTRNEGPRDRIQATKKAVQPRVWLRVQGRARAGEVGATAKMDGYFWIRGTGRMTYGTQKQDFHEYFLKFNQPELRRLDGRWISTLIPRPGAEKGESRGGREAFIWIITRPKDQRPYIDTHDIAEKRPGEQWQYTPVPGLDIPRKEPEDGK